MTTMEIEGVERKALIVDVQIRTDSLIKTKFSVTLKTSTGVLQPSSTKTMMNDRVEFLQINIGKFAVRNCAVSVQKKIGKCGIP